MEAMEGGNGTYKSKTGLSKYKNIDLNNVIDVEFTSKVKNKV